VTDKISTEEKQAAYDARWGEPTDTYTWDYVVDKVWPLAEARGYQRAIDTLRDEDTVARLNAGGDMDSYDWSYSIAADFLESPQGRAMNDKIGTEGDASMSTIPGFNSIESEALAPGEALILSKDPDHNARVANAPDGRWRAECRCGYVSAWTGELKAMAAVYVHGTSAFKIVP
jgi:hypothetical protein